MLRTIWKRITANSVPSWTSLELVHTPDAARRLNLIEHFGGDARFVGLIALQQELPELQQSPT